MTNKTKEFLFEFLDNDVTVDDFEQWIYKNKDLETLQPTLYQDLILFDYTDKNSRQQIREKLNPYINKAEFDVWRTINLLTKIIEDKIDLVLASRKLRQLYYDTNETFIPKKLGIGFDSVFDPLPVPAEYYLWDKDRLKKELKMVDLYRDDMKREAKELLKKING